MATTSAVVDMEMERVTKPKPAVKESLNTVGGNGTYSYFNNSYYQRVALQSIKERIDEAIMEKLDVEGLSSTSNNTIHIADLGCAVGPNTIIAVQQIIETMKHKYKSISHDTPLPEFQVFFNDQVTNDFNTLFGAIPSEKTYFAAGVPGSFHSRLFPESSLHFVFCAIALHWLSRVPEEVLDEKCPSWNKGRIHYTSAPIEVFRAYEAQFAEDMAGFLSARAKEIAVGGMVLIIVPAIPAGMPHSEIGTGIMYDLMGSSFMDMVNEGLISEGQVDSFNVPVYSTTPEEMKGLVESNGGFSIEEMELINPSASMKGPVNMREWTNHMRAASHEMFVSHFQNEHIADMFERLILKLEEPHNAHKVEIGCRHVQLFLVLKRI